MHEVDETYRRIASAPHSTECRLDVFTSTGASVASFSEEDIVSMNTARGLFKDEISIGNAISGEIEVELFPRNVTIPKMAMLKPYVRLNGYLTKHIWEKYGLTIVDGAASSLGFRFSSQTETSTVTLYKTATIVSGEIVLSDAIEVTFSFRNWFGLQTALNDGYEFISWSDGNFYRVISITVSISTQEYNVILRSTKLFVGRSARIETVEDYDRNTYPDDGISGDYWYQYQGSEQEPAVSEWLQKGVFWIDTRSTSYASDRMKIHGYDAMLKMESMNTSTSTQSSALLTAIENYAGITIDDKSSIASATILNPTWYTRREILQMVAAWNGGNWYFADNGHLRLVKLNSLPQETYYLVTERLENLVFGGDRILIEG